MQPAPAVSLACADGGTWRRSGLVLTALVAAFFVRWSLGWLVPDVSWAWPVAGAAGFAAAWLQSRRRPRETGSLRWDGQAWQWLSRPDAAPIVGWVSVAVDLGGWMLLRFRAADGGPTHWLPVAQVGAAARGALFAAPPASTGVDGRRVV